MSLNPAYGPQNETASEIFLESTFLQGGYLTAVGNGVQFAIYLECMKALLRKSPTLQRNTLCFYLTTLCVLNTIWMATTMWGLQATFIDYRNYPGGPFAFLGVEFTLPINILSNICFIATNILADALLVWRCFVVWSATGLNRRNLILVMAFPVLMFAASIAMGVVTAIRTSSPSSGLFGAPTFVFALPYFTISFALNILLTVLIGGRIIARKRSLGLSGRLGSQYTNVATIFIESAALYAISSILFLATFASNNPVNQIWLGITPAVQLVSNYLIIYRIAEGSAWSSKVITDGGGPTLVEETQASSVTQPTGWPRSGVGNVSDYPRTIVIGKTKKDKRRDIGTGSRFEVESRPEVV